MTFVAYRVIPVKMPTAGFAYLLLVLVVASTRGLLEAAGSSILAALVFDYFFAPPVLGFMPTKSEDSILFSFAVKSLIASHLSTTVKRRTSEVIRAEEALRRAQSDLAHVSRITTLGELTASLAHEVNQPISTAITDANTCLRCLSRDHPDVEEAREAATRMAKDATRAAEVASRIRLLFRKVTPQHELVDVNQVIREIIVLLRSAKQRDTPYRYGPNWRQILPGVR